MVERLAFGKQPITLGIARTTLRRLQWGDI
jgi:hypothetical protein